MLPKDACSADRVLWGTDNKCLLGIKNSRRNRRETSSNVLDKTIIADISRLIEIHVALSVDVDGQRSQWSRRRTLDDLCLLERIKRSTVTRTDEEL